MRTLAFLFLLSLASSAGASYRCVDAQGKTHVGDSSPPACASAVTFEISRSGAIVRRIDPASSADASNAATQRQAADRVAAAKRADRALLDSYTSIQEIDRARERSVEMIR